jgi:Mn2+/Fe2+ NRAMP family transporter
MAAIQLICARIGLVSGQGLADAVRRHYPRPFLDMACLLLLVANVFNISADLARMAESAAMLTGAPASAFVAVFGVFLFGGDGRGADRDRYSGSAFSRYIAWMMLVARLIGPNHFS